MSHRRLLIAAVSIGLIVVIIGIIILTLALTPEQAHPAYTAAVEFVNAAGHGDDAAAFALLSDDLQTYVSENCADGSVSACIAGYTPPEWGRFLSAVYRRSAPDGADFDVRLIATYAENEGFSGVCIYQRMQQNEAGEWRVYGWSGFISCGDAEATDLTAPAAPNRAP